MNRKIGISILCFGLFSVLSTALPNGLSKLLRRVRIATADGLQIVPLWFLRRTVIANLSQDNVISLEGEWNGGYLMNTWRNKDRLKRDSKWGIPLSPFYDVILFMAVFGISRGKVRFMARTFPQAITIDAGIEGSVIETQPDGDQSWTMNDCPLVVDTFHVLERFEDDDQALTMIREIAYRAVCIHIQWRNRDFTKGMLMDFFSSKGYLHDALEALLRSTNENVPVIIEIAESDLIKHGFTMTQLVAHIKRIATQQQGED